MKKSAAIEALLSGRLLLVAEYRSFKVEPISYRDKKTGSMISRHIAKHSCEAGETQFQVSQFMPDDYNHEKQPAQRPFPKGTMIVVAVDTFQQEKGFVSVSGDMEALEDDMPVSTPAASPAKVRQ